MFIDVVSKKMLLNGNKFDEISIQSKNPSSNRNKSRDFKSDGKRETRISQNLNTQLGFEGYKSHK